MTNFIQKENRNAKCKENILEWYTYIYIYIYKKKKLKMNSYYSLAPYGIATTLG